MTGIRVDLVSDTQTRPTPAMREAMARAIVGDEQYGEDPDTNTLCATVATMLGKEAAVFMPSGTMCNQVALLVHCEPGDEVLADQNSHIVGSEAGGVAALAGAMIRPLCGERGIFSADDVVAAIRPAKRNAPRTRVVALEQTVNRGGGSIWPVATIRSVADAAHQHGLAVHLDGARLLNAAVASGVPAREYTVPCDSAWLDLSKGLGCPVGAVLAGTSAFIERAWRWKQRLGGAMRQSGVLAAAGIYALQHHVDRLADDHAHARRFADGIAAIPGIRLDPAVIETNLVFFDVRGTRRTAPEIGQRLLQRGIRIGAESRWRMRAVTHLDVDAVAIDEAVATLAEIALY